MLWPWYLPPHLHEQLGPRAAWQISLQAQTSVKRCKTFARTFSTLTASTVPVLDAMRISAEVVSNLPMKAAVEDAAVRVREGAPIGKSLGQSRAFPPMMIHLISSGESSGELDTMLERAAIHQERELDSILQGVVGLLGPLMILAMGGLVLLIVLAMLMPIFELNQLVK